jgi:hypothetical protein
MKHVLMGIAVAGLWMSVSVMAEEAAPTAAPTAEIQKPAPPPLVEMTATGILKREEKVGMTKTGTEKKYMDYTVVQADGSVVTVNQPGGKNPAVKLDPFVDRQVKVTGKGRTVVNTKTNAQTTTIEEIVSVEEAPAPAAAPAGEKK